MIFEKAIENTSKAVIMVLTKDFKISPPLKGISNMKIVEVLLWGWTILMFVFGLLPMGLIALAISIFVTATSGKAAQRKGSGSIKSYLEYLKEKFGEDSRDKNTVPEAEPTEKQPLPISGAYKKRWLLTYNEKDAYKKLQSAADEIGYTVFSKVRLLDLLEPVSGKNYRSYFYKVQAKHVDFVLLDEKLVARCIVELDDASHDADNRKARDAFVDEVVTSVGYQIIHTRAVTDETIEQLKAIFKQPMKD